MTNFTCRAKNDHADERVRHPVVAGQFYSGDAQDLRTEVEGYLSEADLKLDAAAQMVVSPHAGYMFSGEVAAKAYAAVDRNVRTVFLLGPSHRSFFEGLSIPEVDSYETPLGRVPLATDIISRLRSSDLVRSVPAAHAAEHCLEVQVPFLQVALPESRIVPIVMGRVAPEDVAALLEPHLDKHTLVVASSDLSHYHPHSQAKKIDAASIETILKGDMDGPIDGCGEQAVRVLMHLATRLGLAPVLLDARNSHETAPSYSGADQVVGYAAIAYVKADAGVKAGDERESSSTSAHEDLSVGTKQYLLSLARAGLESAVTGKPMRDVGPCPDAAKPKRGCFVTLTEGGRLRGCIGNIEPDMPLHKAVVDNAGKSALDDPRFPNVTPSELDHIKIEVSVLTKPRPLPFSSPEELLTKLEPGRHGVILRKGFHQSTFLPQVWDQLPDKISFLQHLARKAGMPHDGWKDAHVKTYQALHFEEGE